MVALLCLVGLNALTLSIHWYRGRKGLDQWPEPHGRFYREWLRLPESAGDYYEWLANRMDNREPWASWAKLDKQVSEKMAIRK